VELHHFEVGKGRPGGMGHDDASANRSQRVARAHPHRCGSAGCKYYRACLKTLPGGEMDSAAGLPIAKQGIDTGSFDDTDQA
jgi:hypothetical protein